LANEIVSADVLSQGRHKNETIDRRVKESWATDSKLVTGWYSKSTIKKSNY
jgi:hypothetical protein